MELSGKNKKLIAENVVVFNKDNKIEETKDVEVTYVTINPADSKGKDYRFLAQEWSKQLSSDDKEDTIILNHFLNPSVSNTMIQQMNNFEKPFVLSYHRENTIGCEGVIPLRINPETKTLNSTLSNEIKMGVYELGKDGDIQVIITPANYDINQSSTHSQERKEIDLKKLGIVQYEVNPFNTCIGLENDYFKNKKIDFFINDTEIGKREFVTNNNGNNLYSVAVDSKDYLKGTISAIKKLQSLHKNTGMHFESSKIQDNENYNDMILEGNFSGGGFDEYDVEYGKEGIIIQKTDTYFKPKPIPTNFSTTKVDNSNNKEMKIS